MLRRVLHAARSSYRCFSTDGEPCRTALYELHVSKDAKFVPFAGYMMPLHYKGLTPAESHLHTRNHVSVFDVSHMLQTEVRGKDQCHFINSLTPSDCYSLPDGHGTLTVFLTESGGIIDDLIYSKLGDRLYVVSNAGCRDKDQKLMTTMVEKMKSESMDVSIRTLSDEFSLLAIQGPEMVQLLEPGLPDKLSNLKFMQGVTTKCFDIENCHITRCGYTGEDGVEISVPSKHVVQLTDRLLSSSNAKVELAGLAARDTLRIEAGLCLYGQDMNESTTPVETGLTWLINKARRQTADFPGASVILDQIKNKAKVKRSGFVFNEPRGPVPRIQQTIVHGGRPIGQVTSGCPSPILGKNIGMGLISNEPGCPKIGDEIAIMIRNKEITATIVKMPFVPAKYFM